MGDRRVRRAALAAAAAAGIVLVGFPIFDMARAGGEYLPDAFGDAFGSSGAGRAVWNTAWTSVVASGLALAIGLAAALVTERSSGRRRNVLRVVVLTPLLVPPFVSALAWERAFGPGGLLDDLVGVHLPGLIGPAGVVAVIAVNVSPLAYLVIAAGMASALRPEQEWAARVSGAGPATVLRRVTLPLLRPSLVAGGALAFAAGVNAFGVPVVLGLPAGFGTITTRIYRDLALSASPAAFGRVVILALTLAVLAATVVGAADLISRRRADPVLGGGAAEPSSSAVPRSRTGPRALWAYLSVTTLVPLAALVLTALTRGVGLPPTPGNLTLANFAEAVSGRFWGPLGRSLLLATLAATGAVVLGFLLAGVSGRSRSGAGLGTAVIAAFAIPGSALAVAVLLAYGPWLRDTLALILIAYLAKFWALGHRSVAGSLGALPRDALRAARACGAGPVATARRIALPLLAPAIGAGWLLVFLFGFHELTMSSLLYGPGTDTLAVVILNLRQLGDVLVTAALAVLLTLPALAATVVMVRRGDRPGMGLQ